MMQPNSLNWTIEDRVALLMVDRPQQLNALNQATLIELKSALSALAQDDSVHVIVLTGAGDKAFVAGADIKEMVGLDPLGAAAFAQQGQQVLAQIAALAKPVIAAVNGYALGGGFELALACDFIYAVEGAKFGLPETTLGVMPGFGGTQKLTRLVGTNISKEMIFTGMMISAKEAVELGIVNRVVVAGELIDTALQTAKAIATNGGVGVAFAKEAIGKGADMPLADALAYEGNLFALLLATKDQKEGMSAFVEKRRAAFINK
jgi:enoyl-CoA hydratase